MKLDNDTLSIFISAIKLKEDAMPAYRTQINHLKERLEEKIKNDERTGFKVTKYLLTGSWKKRTILRATGENPIDVDLVLFVGGDETIADDLPKLHDYIVEYLQDIYPGKDISKDVDAEGKTKSIKIRFTGSGLELDIVPVIPISIPEYVWQPQRGGGNQKYVTSVSKQLSFAKSCKDRNPVYTSVVRALKWWRNYKELRPKDDEAGLSSFAIELIVSHLESTKGIANNTEDGIIRFFKFLSTPNFPVITFKDAIGTVPQFDTPVFIADPTNNANNAAKKLHREGWKEVIEEASDAYESLCIAQSKRNEGDTIDEWKRVFGPSFKIK